MLAPRQAGTQCDGWPIDRELPSSTDEGTRAGPASAGKLERQVEQPASFAAANHVRS